MSRLLLSSAFSLLGTIVLFCAQPGQADEPAELAGEWVLTIDTPRGVQNPTMVIDSKNGSYSGVYNSRRGPINIESVQVDGNRFAFPLTITVPIGDIEVNYRGEINGDDMTGEVENPRGAVPFTGTRKSPSAE